MNTNRVILITGAAGFVGAHFVEHFLKNTNDILIGVDCLNYSGTWDRLRDVDIEYFNGEYTSIVSAYNHPRFTPMTYDFRQPAEPNLIRELKEVTHVIHMGAESHVDNSIEDPLKFANSNVLGCVNMLNLARELPKLELFVYFSTDEVFGPAPMVTSTADSDINAFKALKGYSESDPHNPKNPYAASKSAAEMFVISFANTYGLPCIITRQMNIIGERQHPEKFVPLCIKAAIEGLPITIHSTPDKKQAGMRHYIHARNVADAHLWLLNETPWMSKGVREVESYHVVGELEVDNLELAKTIDKYVKECYKEAKGIKEFRMVDFHGSRPGHDLRYALDGSKMKGIGWTPPKTFHQSLKKVIEWEIQRRTHGET